MHYAGSGRREAKSIAERKNTLAVKLANVAEIGAERMEEMIGKASLHDTTIATGVATDKVLALTSQTPSINIVNIPMPSAEERAEMRALDTKLDAIAAKLKAGSVLRPQPGRRHPDMSGLQRIPMTVLAFFLIFIVSR
jgi:hypothetical protein